VRLRVACMLAVIGAAGCGDRPPLATACRDGGEAAVRSALHGAPGHVALADGTALSTCVERAYSDADLQVVGAALTAAGDGLARAAARDPHAALELGFLDGAATRGAGRTNGIASELANRLDHLVDGGSLSPAARAAYARGRAAGLASG
jgi:hypothetical protein